MYTYNPDKHQPNPIHQFFVAHTQPNPTQLIDNLS